MTDYRQLCIDLFGTDDEIELKAIAGRLRAGRKKAINKESIEKALSLQKEGVSTAEIAKQLNVSRQTLSKYLNKPFTEDYVMRLDYMFKQTVCTMIYIDYKNQKIQIINRTDDILHRAFGINENPTWEDFEEFLRSRCFPESRANKKAVIKQLKLSYFDPLQIIEKTKGRMAEDHHYFNIKYREGGLAE